MPSSKPPKPSEVAAETKRHYIPLIREQYADYWPTYSDLIPRPLQMQTPSASSQMQLTPPEFHILTGDPVDVTIAWQLRGSTSEQACRIPFVCSANDQKPGGDWETGVIGYEERLCRRSNLSATLSTPRPDSEFESNYPIPSEGGIMSEYVVVFRGPHDRYKVLSGDQWANLPIVSISPVRAPKIKHGGAEYAFDVERELVQNKMRAALRICMLYNYREVVIGDFALGKSYRNPPQGLAEMWREVFLYDPYVRGWFHQVAFVFEDPAQSTTRLILDSDKKKSSSSHHSSKGKGKSKSHSSSHGSSSSSSSSSNSASANAAGPTDYDIFRGVFHKDEIQLVLARADPRYDISMMIIAE